MTLRLKTTVILTGLLLLMSLGLAQANESATGVIENSGFSGIVINGAKYNTGRETKYEPSDYRPISGDTVTVTFYEKILRNGNTIQAVSNLKLVKKDPNRKDLESPAKGTIQEIGRKKIRFDFPSIGRPVSLEQSRRTVLVPAGWSPAVGDKVVVTFRRVKSRFGNNFVLIIEQLEKED